VVSKLAPLASARVAAALRKGIAELFSSYTTALRTAFARHRGADGRFPDALGAGSIVLSPVSCCCQHETPGVCTAVITGASSLESSCQLQTRNLCDEVHSTDVFKKDDPRMTLLVFVNLFFVDIIVDPWPLLRRPGRG